MGKKYTQAEVHSVGLNFLRLLAKHCRAEIYSANDEIVIRVDHTSASPPMVYSFPMGLLQQVNNGLPSGEKPKEKANEDLLLKRIADLESVIEAERSEVSRYQNALLAVVETLSDPASPPYRPAKSGLSKDADILLWQVDDHARWVLGLRRASPLPKVTA
jgi:hypothetical protein